MSDNFCPMRILVTGSGGYIGAHLIQELMQNNYEILALSGRAPTKFSRLNQIGIRGIPGDTRNQDFLEKKLGITSDHFQAIKLFQYFEQAIHYNNS